MGIGRIVRQLETKPRDRWLVATLAGGLLLLIVSIVLFLPYFEILSPSGYSIVDQQTVFTYEANERVLAAWKAIDGGIHASLMCAYIDLFPFMPAYAALGFAWGLLVARRFFGTVRTVGIVGSLCIFPAWLADIVETGIQAIISLRVETYSPGLVPIMSTAAVIKTVLFRAAVLWCVLATVFLVVRALIRRLRPAER
jgi:hypothetical protein